MLVIDASVLAVALLDDGQDGDAARLRLRGEQLAAPALIDLEVVSVWRGLARAGHLDPRRVGLALDDLQDLPIQRVEHTAFLTRCWELRDNLTIYDAAYVALAEALQVPLLTGDRRLARSTGPRCTIEVVITQHWLRHVWNCRAGRGLQVRVGSPRTSQCPRRRSRWPITIPATALGRTVGYLTSGQDRMLARAIVLAYDLDIPLTDNS